MAEAQTAEETAKVDAAFLSAGSENIPPAVAPPAKAVEETAPEATAKPAPLVPGPKPVKPEYVRVTRQEWDNTKAATGKIASLESQLAKLTGSIPKADELTQQIIEKVQAQTPAGMAVQFIKEDFAEIADDYPDLAERLERVLNKGKVKGTKGTASATTETSRVAGVPLDEDAFDKGVETALTKREAKQKADAFQKEVDVLLAAYPDWRTTVGAPAVAGGDPVNTPWREWATTNDQAALKTDSPSEVQASIAKFNAISKTPAPATPDKGAARRATLADAVTPRADGAPPPLVQPASVDEAFASGYQKARPKPH